MHRHTLPNEIASFSEGKVLTILGTPGAKDALRRHNERHLSRIYPMGTRFGSSNIPPSSLLKIWFEGGCQLTCTNYQTNDAGQQLNRALFGLNGRCGYVLKRPLMATRARRGYVPNGYLASGEPITLDVRILCAQHLSKPGEERIANEAWHYVDPQGLLPTSHRLPSLLNASNVYCVLECWRPAGDALQMTTRRVDANGLNPSWDEGVTWRLAAPNACFLRLTVYHRGVLKDEIVGTEVLPVAALRQGYRSVSLNTSKGLRLQLAAVLLKIRLSKTAPAPSLPDGPREDEEVPEISSRSGTLMSSVV